MESEPTMTMSTSFIRYLTAESTTIVTSTPASDSCLAVRWPWNLGRVSVQLTRILFRLCACMSMLLTVVLWQWVRTVWPSHTRSEPYFVIFMNESVNSLSYCLMAPAAIAFISFTLRPFSSRAMKYFMVFLTMGSVDLSETSLFAVFSMSSMKESVVLAGLFLAASAIALAAASATRLAPCIFRLLMSLMMCATSSAMSLCWKQRF
ncbi:Uncharacterised protein [uncultured archaeon]|nr:Uncharacterised protein [uncultured archaeon]